MRLENGEYIVVDENDYEISRNRNFSLAAIAGDLFIDELPTVSYTDMSDVLMDSDHIDTEVTVSICIPRNIYMDDLLISLILGGDL